MAGVPPYVPREFVAARLPLIFPEGTPNRLYCTREIAASTVFAFLYVGAVEGQGRFLGPVHVYRMTQEQARLEADADRLGYAAAVLRKRYEAPGVRWYADNSREPIRDETLREGLVGVGAVSVRGDLPTTSGLPRYALKANFAALFDPGLQDDALDDAIGRFRQAHLPKGALARVSLVRSGAAAVRDGVLVTFPNGETRRLAPGPSSTITQAVVESFAPRFLTEPAVLWLSESGNKVVARDDRLAALIGLKIEADRNLPDLILVDLGPTDPLIVFVEIVATDGAITHRRQEALLALAEAAGFPRGQIAFVTAYRDRESAGFKKTVPALAWGSYAWFASEPEAILVMRGGGAAPVPLWRLNSG